MTQTVKSRDREVINPRFNLQRALIAVEAGVTDASILRYLDYFMKLEPIENLSFLHVVPSESLWQRLGKETPKEKRELKQTTVSNLKENILDILKLDKSIHADFHVRSGSPLEELLKEATDFAPDLILTGLSTKRSSHGILAKAIVRHAPCSTLVIPDLAKAHMSHTLVPVDFSVFSAAALQMAAMLNERLTLPGKITCIHVYDIPDDQWFVSAGSPDSVEAYEKELLDELRKFIRTHIPAYCYEIEIQVIPRTEESTGTYIMQAAQDMDADLIVLGAKGHSRLKQLQIGSVTEKVLALTSAIPVLVVK